MFYAQDDNPAGGLGVEPVDLTMAAFVLPPIIALLNQRKWPTEIKALMALLVCAIYSGAVTLVRGEYGWQEWRNALLQVSAGTFVAYKLFWNPSGLAAKIENRTSIPPTTVEQDRILPPTTLQDLPVHGDGQPPAPEEKTPVVLGDVTRSGDTGTEPSRNGGDSR
jgi:hypothetical protein